MKVFISHSSKDESRFVNAFVEKLENKNIETWYDKKDQKIGENLSKIIKEMLKCDYFIGILTKNSLQSNWFKEECDAAFTGRVNNQIKMILINIMEDEICCPIEFQHITQFNIDNINDYDSEFKKLIGEILGISNKSEGISPKYVEFNPITGYEIIDSMVIKTIGDLMMEKGNVLISFASLMELIDDENISENDVDESIRILEKYGLIEFKDFSGCLHPENIKLTSEGILLYSENYFNDYAEVIKNISAIIVNEEFELNENNFNNVNAPYILKLSLIDSFSERGYLKLYKFTNGSFKISNITAIGRRQLKSIINEKVIIYDKT